MLEIGSTLRVARERQGLQLSRVEGETRIRARYLQALENERFDLLPGRAYGRAFLRTYSTYLGLQPQPLVDEFEQRVPAEELLLPPPPPPRRRRVPRAALAALAAAVLALLVAWLESTESGPRSPTRPSSPSPAAPAAAQPAPPPRVTAKPARAVLVLVAARGPCWVSARVGSREGRVLYQDTLEEGRSLRLPARRLWVRLGAPWNLEARLRGRPVRLPGSTGNVLVTAAGLRPA